MSLYTQYFSYNIYQCRVSPLHAICNIYFKIVVFLLPALIKTTWVTKFIAAVEVLRRLDEDYNLILRLKHSMYNLCILSLVITNILYLLIIISCQTELQVNLEQRQEKTLQTLTLHIMEASINVNKTGLLRLK